MSIDAIRSVLEANGNVESLDSTPLIPADDHNNDLEHQNRKFHQAALGVKINMTDPQGSSRSTKDRASLENCF